MTINSADVYQLHQLQNNSIRTIASKLDTSKDAVQRCLNIIKSREDIPGAIFFETQDGQVWLHAFVVATIFFFNIKSKVGPKVISQYLSFLGVAAFVGSSESQIQKIKHEIIGAIKDYNNMMNGELKEKIKELQLTLGADEIAFDNVFILVLMEMSSGFIFSETCASNRTEETWTNSIPEMLKSCKKIIFTISDKGTSILAMVTKHLKAISVCDLFHMFLDACGALGAQVANKVINTEKKIVKESRAKDHSLYNEHVIKYLKEQNDKAVLYQTEYKDALETMTNKTHPYNLDASQLQTSVQVADALKAVHGTFDRILNEAGFSDKGNKLKRFERRITDYSQVIDIWHKYTDDEMKQLNKTSDELSFVKNILLPAMYWKKMIKQTKNKRIKGRYQVAYTEANQRMVEIKEALSISDNLFCELKQFANRMVNMFQRTSSAVEGRNGRLSELFHCLRGVSQEILETSTTIHNYEITRDDDTTAYERMAGVKPPDLLLYVMKRVPSLSQPRKRKVEIQNPRIIQAVAA